MRLRGGDGLESDGEREERCKNWKLRREVEEVGRSESMECEGGWFSNANAGGSMTSCDRVSERSKVIPGGGRDEGTGFATGFCAELSLLLSSSRLWRRPRTSDGIVICRAAMRGEGVDSLGWKVD